MNQRIVVVGGLAAGPSAASKAKRVNPGAQVELLEQGEHISYGICEIPYYVGDVFQDAGHLTVFTPERLEREKGVRVRTLHRVEEIHPHRKSLVVRDLEKNTESRIAYDRLILATGSAPRTLNISGEKGRNVFTVKSLSDGLGMRKYVDEESPRTAVIIGAGYIGMEMAEALVRRGIRTTLIHRHDLPMAQLERDASRTVLEILTLQGVSFVPNSEVRELPCDDTGKVVEVVTSTGRYPSDVVVLCIGVQPNAGLARQIGIRTGERGGILADERQATSVGSIFAAGDCCEIRNAVNNRWMYIPLATYASRQGWVAGENAAGGFATFKGAIRAIAVKVFDLEVAQVGLSVAEAESSGFDPVV
ncbi:MAG: FAD-dependent oxidoreductase, partial [Bacteroidota bacterium]